MSDKEKTTSSQLPSGVVRNIPGDIKQVKNGSNNLPTFLNPPPPPAPKDTPPKDSK